MPAYAYSQYQDPTTGETILLPQLFPHANSTVELSSTELKCWVNAGVVPQELYDSDLQAQLKMEEIRKRVQSGEDVPISELPPTPWALTQYLLTNKARIYEENVLIKIFSKLDDKDPDIVWLSFVKEAFSSIIATDPLQIHFYAARKILKEKYSIDDSRAVDILARELLEHCGNIHNFKSFQHPAFNKNPIAVEDLNDHLKHEKKLMFKLDEEFINYLKGIGPKGKKLAIQVDKNSKELFKFYADENYSNTHRRKVWGLWVPHNDPLNGVFILLGQAIWEDRCSQQWDRQSKQVPAVTRPIIERIKPILNPKDKKNFIIQDETIVCCDREGNPIISAPVIDANMLSVFKNGVKYLGSLTGHKIVRWQIQTGFENWSKNNEDPRLIEIDGGYSRICELCNCGSEHDIAKIKDILQAQAHGYFTFPDGSRGNMITLRVLEKHRNFEPSKISIVLGDILLPNYVFKLPSNARRLIPIGDFPPFYGSKNTYANQSQLQLLVFEEFSNQSDRLAKNGSVLIPDERWQEMANEAGINLANIQKIIQCWCQPDLINCFLDRQGDEYRLTSYYKRVEKFLIYQGEQRLINSERGKKSAASKKIGTYKKS